MAPAPRLPAGEPSAFRGEDGRAGVAAPAEPGAPSRPVGRVLQNRDYRLLWPAGWLWQMGRWVWMLVSGYLVLQLSDSIFLTQLVGVAFFAPMLLGGLLSGVIADGFERRHVLLAGHLCNIAVLGVATAVVVTGTPSAWHILGLTLAFGTFHALDNATRRTFVFDLVGAELIPYALALENMGMTGAMMVGPFFGGALLDLLPLEGSAAAAGPYVAILGLYLAALALLFRIRPPRQTRVPVQIRTVLATTAEGLRAVAGNRALIGILTITVLINVTLFSYLPLVPVFARKVLDVGPTLMGLLASAQGLGALLGSAFIASRRSIPRTWAYYVGGSLLALASLFLFSLSRAYPLSFLALVVTGMGVAGFGTMQGTMVLLSATPEMRGRTMGILATAIGILPVAMLILGGVASALGPGLAVSLNTALGIVLVALSARRAREMRRL